MKSIENCKNIKKLGVIPVLSDIQKDDEFEETMHSLYIDKRKEQIPELVYCKECKCYHIIEKEN